MNPLLLLFIIIMPITIISDFIPRKQKLWIYIMVVSALALIIGNEELHVGADTWTYVTAFSAVKYNDLFKYYLLSWEPGTVLWMKFFTFFSEDMHLFWLGTIVLSFLPTFYMFWKYSINPFVSMTAFIGLGFLQYPMGILRQWLALQFVLLAVDAYFKHKNIRVLFWIFVACLFHRTAVLFLLIYIIHKIPNTFKAVKDAAVLGVVLVISEKFIFSLLNHFARIPMDQARNGGVTMLAVLWLIVLAVSFLNKGTIIDDNNEVFFKLVLIAATLQPLSLSYSLWVRAIAYFSIFVCFLIPGVLNTNFANNTYSILLKNIIIEGLMLAAFLIIGVPEFIFYNTI